MQNKRIKAIISLATIFVVCLLVLTAYLLVNISNKKKEISRQKEEISKLQTELEYYENQNSSSGDNKNGDIEIIIPEEE